MPGMAESSEELDITNLISSNIITLQYHVCQNFRQGFRSISSFHILFEFLTSCKWNMIRCAQIYIIERGGDIIEY